VRQAIPLYWQGRLTPAPCACRSSRIDITVLCLEWCALRIKTDTERTSSSDPAYLCLRRFASRTETDTERFGLAGDREPDVSVWLGDRVEDDVSVFDAEPGEIEG
jgi:hypothetical protein